jgi:hypothetical protein
MRSLLIATSLFLLAAGSSLAQTANSAGTQCPNGQAYDAAKQKCVANGSTNTAKSNSGY